MMDLHLTPPSFVCRALQSVGYISNWNEIKNKKKTKNVEKEYANRFKIVIFDM